MSPHLFYSLQQLYGLYFIAKWELKHDLVICGFEAITKPQNLMDSYIELIMNTPQAEM